MMNGDRMEVDEVPHANVHQSQRSFAVHRVHSAMSSGDFAIPRGYADSAPEYVGTGSYGNVAKTRILSRDGQTRVVAIKKLHQPFSNVAQMIRHDNIIRLVDVYTPQKSEQELRDVYLVTEYAGTSLHDLLKIQNESGIQHLQDDHIKFVIYQVLRGLKYIHSANVIHRDLKPSNLAITESCDVTVLDFGLARTVEKKNAGLSTYVMTRWYRSPEVIYWKIDSYNTQADIWSVGCIAAELMIRRPLFPGADANAQYEMITLLCGTPDKALLDKIETEAGHSMRVTIEGIKSRPRQIFSEYELFRNLPPDFVDFLDKILVLDPEKRMTVEQAIQHEYLREHYLPEDEPVAPAPFTLDDQTIDRTIEQWKSTIWQDIQNFTGDDHSPFFL